MSASCRFCGAALAMPEGETIPLACHRHLSWHYAEEAMARLQRVADSYADASGLPGGGYNPQQVDKNFLELVLDLADPLPDDSSFCTYALVRWAEVDNGMMGLYVSFRKVAKVWDETTQRLEYGHTEDAASFPLTCVADVLDPALVDVAIGWGPENGYVIARLLLALGQLFPKGE